MRHRSTDIAGFINMMFPTHRNAGQVSVGVKTPSGSFKRPSLSTMDLGDSMTRLCSDKDTDYYICPLSTRGNSKLKSKQWFENAVVIDCDVHDKHLDVDLREDLINEFVAKFVFQSSREELLPPTAVAYTGRGVQIWWALTEVHANTKGDATRAVLNKLKNAFIYRIREVLDDNPTLADAISIDVPASTRKAPLFRVPGTYNTAYHDNFSYKVEYEAVSGDKYSFVQVNEFQKEYARNVGYAQVHFARRGFIPSGARTQRTKGNTSSASVTTRAGRTLLQTLDYICRLTEYRTKTDTIVLRNNTLLLYYSIAKEQFGHHYAYNMVKILNSTLSHPFSIAQLENCISSATRKDYTFRAATISLLAVTDVEESVLGPVPIVGAEKMAKTKVSPSRKKKIKGMKRIMAMLDKGESVAYIAKELKIHRSTVYRAIESLKLDLPSKQNETTEENTTSNEAMTLLNEVKKFVVRETNWASKLLKISTIHPEDPAFTKEIAKWGKTGRRHGYSLGLNSHTENSYNATVLDQIKAMFGQRTCVLYYNRKNVNDTDAIEKMAHSIKRQEERQHPKERCCLKIKH